MSEFFNSISQVKQNWQSYEKWDKEQDDKEARRKELHKTRPISQNEMKEAEKRGKTIINAINVMDEYSENKAEDMEQATQALGEIPTEIGSFAGMGLGYFLGKNIKNPKAKLLLNPWSLGFLGAALSYVPFSIWSTKVQVWASKVARFQAREKELKNPGNFVVYSDDQIKEAETIAKTLPGESNDKSLLKKMPLADMIATVQSVNKDKKAYDSWYEDYLKEDAETKASYPNGIPADKLNKTKRDQQVIINTVKNINEFAEDYSESVENATNTMGLPISMASGAIIGFTTNAVLNMLKKSNVIKENGFVSNAKGGIASFAGIIVGLLVKSWFNSMQKEGAKIGRFKAKQELLSDPQNFVYCDDKETGSTKAPEPKKKKFFVAESWQTLMDVIKDKKEYDNYQKTKGKEDKKLRRALKLVKLKDGQLEEAKNLQEKTFNTFEKMDEMSQKYSENVEAATDIATMTIPFAALFSASVAALGAWVLGEKFVKNKSPQELVTSITKKLEKFKDNKFVQNLIKDMGEALTEFSEKVMKDSLKLGKNAGNQVNKLDLVWKMLKKPRIRNVAIAGAIPIAAGFLGSIFAVQSYFTKLQLKAGKIGVMKAMQELEDPRYFVDKYDVSTNNQPAEKTAQSNPQTPTDTQNAAVKNWMDKIQQKRAIGST